MRSPAEMGAIQMDITNACTRQCSNCTRFCGNHKKPFFMDFDTFKRAVDSLEGYNGNIGLMGGEPTLHPEFDKFTRYLQSKYGKYNKTNRLLYPSLDFIKEMRHRECESRVLRERPDGSRYIKSYGPALFSNMGSSYKKHYELIQDTFTVQYLNDHKRPSYHQPGLFSRKDLGISDEEWIPMRDKCWIQNEWSATVTPKGAFFCEIAGALDMLFDGPGGWKVEPGWWKRTPDQFEDQLHWCDICGFALDTFMRDAREECDDASPTLYEMLKHVDSPKMKSGRVNCVEIINGVIKNTVGAEDKNYTATQPYMENYEDRYVSESSILAECEYCTADVSKWSDFGHELSRVLGGSTEWILLITKDDNTSDEIVTKVGTYVFNPGCIHLGKGYAFFSNRASSVKRIGLSEIAHMNSLGELLDAWDGDKIISLSELEEVAKLKRASIKPGRKYALWGTGMFGTFIADAVVDSGGVLSVAVDADKDKWGTSIKGVTIQKPDVLVDDSIDFDELLIGHYTRFEEIQREAIKIGIPEDKIRLPYEV